MTDAAGQLPVLHQIVFSHFNEKARWGLDYKGIPHRRRNYPPGPHIIASRRLGGSGTMPVLELDGERITDSAEILEALERTQPDPPLYPADEAQRRQAVELERFFGEGLGPGVRSAFFYEMLPDGPTARRISYQDVGWGHRAFAFATWPVSRAIFRRALGADAAGAERGRAKTVEALDRIEAELDGGDYLVGDRFSVADLTGAALLLPLVVPRQLEQDIPDPGPGDWERFRDEHRDRSAWAWAERMWAKHRGSSAEVK